MPKFREILRVQLQENTRTDARTEGRMGSIS